MFWMDVLRIVTLVLQGLVTLAYAYQFVYLILPFFSKKKETSVPQRKKYAVLIPARNEEQVIPHLLDTISSQDYPEELVDVYVVADNCTDHTADTARNKGAHVLERFNTVEVGKGYALRELLAEIDRHKGLSNYDAFLVFDADNLLEPDYITCINRLCEDGYPAFCGCRNTKNYGTNWLTECYGAWYLHDSTHLNRSRQMIGASAFINGTGFGFTRALLEEIGGWQFFTLTEDIEFNMYCVSHGYKIGYCHEAVLYDEQPVSFSQSWRQRTRWAQGGIQVAAKHSKALFAGLFKGNWISYSCFENMTLSLWGVIFAAIGMAFGFALTVLEFGLLGLLILAGSALVSSYSSFFLIGLLTVLSEWQTIPATDGQKIASIFVSPFYMMTFIPIALLAPFRKFTWAPIKHGAAVDMDEMKKQKEKNKG